MSNPSRRNFLRGRLSACRSPAIHPPGAHAGFLQLCTQCGDCSRACPQAIVVQSVSGFPELDFSKGACTFCQDCMRACPTGALAQDDTPEWPWRASVGATCLSLAGIACRTCEDGCGEQALRFRLVTGGRAIPLIDTDLCTGCGECAYVCPAGAITFTVSQPAQEVQA